MTGANWRMTDGEPVSCREKLRVLAENEDELLALMQDAFEDAVLMGVDEACARDRFAGLAASLRSPHR
jgi:hypothetical protein